MTADWHADPMLANLLTRMTKDGLIGWQGRVGSPQRRPMIRSYGKSALAALQVLHDDAVSRETVEPPTSEGD